MAAKSWKYILQKARGQGDNMGGQQPRVEDVFDMRLDDSSYPEWQNTTECFGCMGLLLEFQKRA